MDAINSLRDESHNTFVLQLKHTAAGEFSALDSELFYKGSFRTVNAFTPPAYVRNAQKLTLLISILAKQNQPLKFF